MTISLVLTKDCQEIKSLLSKDELYKDIALGETLDGFLPNMVSTSWFKIKENKETVGLFILSEVSNNCASFHGGLFMEYRHQHTSKILLACLDFIHKLLDYQLITFVKSTNIPMIKVFKKAGLVHMMTIKKGYKDSDMLIFGESI